MKCEFLSWRSIKYLRMRRLQQIYVVAISSVRGSSEHRHTAPPRPLRPGPSGAKQCQQLGKHKPLTQKKRKKKEEKGRKVLDDCRGKPNNVVRTLAMSSEASRCCFSGNVHMQIKSLWFHGAQQQKWQKQQPGDKLEVVQAAGSLYGHTRGTKSHLHLHSKLPISLNAQARVPGQRETPRSNRRHLGWESNPQPQTSKVSARNRLQRLACEP